MKKTIYFIIIIFLNIVALYFCLKNVDLSTKLDIIKKKYDQLELYDASGNINLSELESQRNKLEEDLLKVFSDDNLKIKVYQDNINKTKKENDIKEKQIISLSKKVDDLEDYKSSLAKEYKVLDDKYQELLRERARALEEELRRSTIQISNVPVINQYPKLPTGCESVALTILLNYYGVNVSTDSVVENLKKGDLPHYEDNVMYGGNPFLEFIGTPYSYDSYGVYNNPLADVANIYKSGVITKDNLPFNEVLALVKEGRPVVVWTSMNLAVPYISSSWIYKLTGEKISWKSNEHAVVIIGFNSNNVIISDPLTGTIRHQSRVTFESRYNYYGRRAVYY